MSKQGFWRREKTWWVHFTVNGQRFRQSTETSNWQDAQAKKKELVAKAEAGMLTPKSREFARLGFSEAAEKQLSDRLPTLAQRSIQTERERLKPLHRFFGEQRVSRISHDVIRDYIRERKESGVANKTVNLELGVLRGVLKRAKLWQSFSDEIKPLPVEHEIGRAMSPDERERLEAAALAKPEWQNARWAMTLALNTTMRACELKGLQWRDINFIDRALTVRKSKTDAGKRVIPLNAEAWEAILALYHRAQKLGGTESGHYVFPACENSKTDPTKPQKSWRSAWRSLRKSANLSQLRFHDLRHHAITELAESEASDSTIMSIAGHVSREMLEHYSHIRLEAKRDALDALSRRGRQQGTVTNLVTSTAVEDVSGLATIRKDWSGREDLNLRPPGPEPGALPG